MGTPRSKKLPGTRLLLALLTLALLTGCTVPAVPIQGEPSPSAAAPAASAPATPAPGAVLPVSRLDLDCADLVPEELVADTVAASVVAVPYGSSGPGAGPLGSAVEQLGGNACAGTDPSTAAPVDGSGASVPGYSVFVLPDAIEQYTRYAEMYPGVITGDGAAYGDSAGGACFGRGAESQCSSSILVGSTWIEVALTGISADAALSDSGVAARVAPLIQSIVTTVADAPAPGPVWTIPAGTVALPEDCATYATVDDVRTAFDRPEELWVGPTGGGGWSLPAGAWTMAGAQRCAWLLAGSDVAVVVLEALPGGVWAFDAAAERRTQAQPADAVDTAIPGVERVVFGCDAVLGTCTLDTVIGGNWVQFSADTPPDDDPDTVRDRLIRVAAGAAARLIA
jgi:hypothetical protein